MERRKERGRKKAQAHSSLLRTFCPPDKLLRKFPPKHTRGWRAVSQLNHSRRRRDLSSIWRKAAEERIGWGRPTGEPPLFPARSKTKFPSKRLRGSRVHISATRLPPKDEVKLRDLSNELALPSVGVKEGLSCVFSR